MGVRESKYVEQKKVSEVTQEVCFEGMKYTFKSRHHLTRHHPHIHTHTHTHTPSRTRPTAMAAMVWNLSERLPALSQN